MATNLRNGAQILVDQLLIQGARHAFGVPGESYLPVLDALHDTVGRLDFVICRHEAAAANMAEAYGKLTGQPGLCFVTRAPGATHASTGLFTAFQDSTPMILFIGQVARNRAEREAWQEVDYRRMFGGIAKWVAQIDDASRIPEFVSRAYHQARNGRPGPVVLALPEDMLKDRVAAHDASQARRARQAPGDDALTEFRLALEGAQRPLLIAGGGGWDAASCADLQSFAEKWTLPVSASFRRQDLLDTRHDLYVGEFGPGTNPALEKRVRDSDLLIVLGARLGEASTGGYTLLDIPRPRQRLVHIHADPDELGRVYTPDLPIAAAPGEFVAAVCRLDGSGGAWGGWSQDLRRDYLAWSTPKQSLGNVDLAAIMAGLAERLPPQTIVTNGAGNYTTWLHRYYHYRGFRTQLAPTSGAMGYGIPAAIAAKLANPDRPVIAFAGDGCFLMNGQELITATQYGLPIVVIIINNNSFGTIRMHQERNYPGRVFGTDLANPDFVALAHAYGALGERITTTQAFWPALARALAHHGPAVIEVITDVEQLTPQATVSGLRAAAAQKAKPKLPS